MNYQPPRYRFLPPWLWKVLMVLLLLGIAYRLGAFLWEELAR